MSDTATKHSNTELKLAKTESSEEVISFDEITRRKTDAEAELARLTADYENRKVGINSVITLYSDLLTKCNELNITSAAKEEQK
jgi:hypothetical protein